MLPISHPRVRCWFCHDVAHVSPRGTDNFETSRRWTSDRLEGRDEWRTGYFDITHGEYVLKFTTGLLLQTAIDDVKLLPGKCQENRMYIGHLSFRIKPNENNFVYYCL